MIQNKRNKTESQEGEKKSKMKQNGSAKKVLSL